LAVESKSFIDQKRKEIGERLRELQPLVDEHKRLKEADKALERIMKPAPRRGRPPGSGRKKK